MADAALHEAPAVPDLLAALWTAAPSEAQAQAALRTFVLAQSVGWQEAQGLTGWRTWYRHLQILADAGIAVPLRPYGNRPRAAASPAPTLADLRRAVGQRITVVDSWEPDFHPAGTTGLVAALLFQDGRWLIRLEVGRVGECVDLPIREFYQRCELSAGGAPDAG